jgi:hypothetical protein
VDSEKRKVEAGGSLADAAKTHKRYNTESWFRCRLGVLVSFVLFRVTTGAMRSVSNGSGLIAPLSV